MMRPGDTYAKGGAKTKIKRDDNFGSKENQGFGKGKFANNTSSNSNKNSTKASTTKSSTTKVVGEKFTDPGLINPGKVGGSKNVKKSNSNMTQETTVREKPKSAREIRREGKQLRKESFKKNRRQKAEMRLAAADKIKADVFSGRADRAKIGQADKTIKQEGRQQKQVRKLQNRLNKLTKSVEQNQTKRTDKKFDASIVGQVTKAGEVVSSALNMKSPVKMMQNQQGVQGAPYQDVNQMNYNFDPLSQQRAQQMQMPINNSPLNRELVGNQHKLPKEIKDAIKKAK